MQTKSQSIAIQESIFIRQSSEAVWDFTQDFSRRTLWDKSIQQVEVLRESPTRSVRVRGRGFSCIFEYKAADRPSQTSVIMKDVVSSLVTGGGGSWKYETQGNGCLWTQSMRIDLKPRFGLGLFLPLLSFLMRRQVRKSMRCARDMIEMHDMRTAQSATT